MEQTEFREPATDKRVPDAEEVHLDYTEFDPSIRIKSEILEVANQEFQNAYEENVLSMPADQIFDVSAIKTELMVEKEVELQDMECAERYIIPDNLSESEKQLFSPCQNDFKEELCDLPSIKLESIVTVEESPVERKSSGRRKQVLTSLEEPQIKPEENFFEFNDFNVENARDRPERDPEETNPASDVNSDKSSDMENVTQAKSRRKQILMPKVELLEENLQELKNRSFTVTRTNKRKLRSFQNDTSKIQEKPVREDSSIAIGGQKCDLLDSENVYTLAASSKNNTDSVGDSNYILNNISDINNSNDQIPWTLDEVELILSQIRHLLDQIPQILSQVPQILNQIAQILNKIPHVLNQGPHILDQVPQILNQVPQILNQVPQILDQVPKILDQVPKILDKIPQALNQVPQALDQTPQVFDQDPQVFDQEPQVFDQEPHVFDQEPQVSDQELQVLDPESQVLNQVPQVLDQEPKTLGQAPQVLGQAPQLLNQVPQMILDQEPHILDRFPQTPNQILLTPDQISQISHTISENTYQIPLTPPKMLETTCPVSQPPKEISDVCYETLRAEMVKYVDDFEIATADDGVDYSFENDSVFNYLGNSSTPSLSIPQIVPGEKEQTNTRPSSKIKNISSNTSSSRRVWDRKAACIYCGKLVSKLYRHLFSKVHENEPDVICIRKMRKGSAERRYALLKIRNHGNYVHNESVKSGGKGSIIPAKRSKWPNSNTYSPCRDCFVYYKKSELWRHKKICKSKSIATCASSNRQQLMYSEIMMSVPDTCSKKLVENVICKMREDEVTLAAKNDPLILAYGSRLYNKHGNVPKLIGTKMREVSKLLLTVRKLDRSINSLEQCLAAKHFATIVKATKVISGYDEENRSFSVPTLALKIGPLIKLCASILKSQAVVKQDDALLKDLNNFLVFCEINWTLEITAKAISSRNKKKRNKHMIPLAQGIKDIDNNTGTCDVKAIGTETCDVDSNRGLCNVRYVDNVTGTCDRFRTNVTNSRISKFKSTYQECPIDSGKIATKSRKRLVARMPWNDVERLSVEKFFAKDIILKKVPGKMKCEICKKRNSPHLDKRTWQHIKYYVYNKIR